MKKMKTHAMALILLSVMVALSGCGSSNKGADKEVSGNNVEKKPETVETIKLKFYAQYSGQEKAAYDAAKEAMKKVMPEVEVEFEVAAQDDEQKIKTYAAAGTLPDIFFASSGLIETLKNSDNLLVLDDVVKANDIESKLNETSKAMLWNKDGHSYSVPNVGQWAAVIFFNKEIFESNNIKVPANYTELLEAVTALKAKEITPLTLFAKEKWTGVQLLDMAIVGSDPGGLKKLDNGEGTFSDEAYIQGASKLEELVKAGLLSKNAFNTTYDDAVAQFTSGKAAMLLNGAWSMGALEEGLGEGKMGMLYTPFTDADKVDSAQWNISGGGFNQGFAVSKNSKYPEVAAKYAALISLEFNKQRVIQIGDPNSILVEEVQPTVGFTPIQQQYAKDAVNFKSMTTFAWGFENAKFKTVIEDNSQKLLAGQKLDDFIQDMNKELERVRN